MKGPFAPGTGVKALGNGARIEHAAQSGATSSHGKRQGPAAVFFSTAISGRHQPDFLAACSARLLINAVEPFVIFSRKH